MMYRRRVPGEDPEGSEREYTAEELLASGLGADEALDVMTEQAALVRGMNRGRSVLALVLKM